MACRKLSVPLLLLGALLSAACDPKVRVGDITGQGGAGNAGSSGTGGTGTGGMGTAGTGTGGMGTGGGPSCAGGPACAPGQVCTDYGCRHDWAEWPMPNASGLPNPQSYAIAEEGAVVVDNVTGLMWQRTVDAESHTWKKALQYCADLDLAGHDEWRLPSVVELVSIVDYSQESGAAIDPVAFPGAPTDWFWSSTPVAWSPGSAWFVSFGVGLVDYVGVDDPERVRCVR